MLLTYLGNRKPCLICAAGTAVVGLLGSTGVPSSFSAYPRSMEGYAPSSCLYRFSLTKISCIFDMQLAWRALSLALENTGNKRAARIAIIAITTNSSISEKPDRVFKDIFTLLNLLNGG